MTFNVSCKMDAGIRMKVLRGGQLVDENNGVELDEDEFQHLIVMTSPQNPQWKWVAGLRLIFFAFLAVTLATVLFIVVKDYTQAQLTWLMQPVNKSQLLNLHHLQTNPPVGGNATSLDSSTSLDSCLIDDGWKFDCHPANVATADDCLNRGCCWKPLEVHNLPWCYYPLGFAYYVFTEFVPTKTGLRGSAVSTRASPYPKDVKNLNVDIIYETEDIVRIRITDAKNSRYEVPFEYSKTSYDKKPDILNYSVVTSRYGIQIFRSAEKTPVFDTTIAPMIYSNQYLEISTTLQTHYLYGIGESVDFLKRTTNGSRYVLYNHDRIPGSNTNNYGSHPFYMIMDKMGRSHGVFLANSNAMEITVQSAPSLTFRTLGGILDLRIFVGPKPRDVTDQYTQIIGRPMIPPYWSLGYHLCRFNYGTLNHTAEILQNNLQGGLPIDVQWNDLDYMHHSNDFTYDPVKFAGLPDFIDDIHSKGMRYVPLIDPGISSGEAKGKYIPYEMGVEMDIFIKNSQGHIFEGHVWNKKGTVWPDFSHPNVTHYWMRQLDSFRKRIKFDGAWIDMNEPSNFYNGEKNGCIKTSVLDNPPYVPRQIDGNTLYYKTICPSAKQAGGTHYDLHNLYGTQETIATYKALGDIVSERPFIISRATFPGQGRYGGHWTGDVVSNWEDLRQTIPQILTFGLFGIPMVGADICGFNGNATADLCKRWQQLGAFYPFARNHNTDDGIPQDPWSMGKDVFEAAKETLKVRYDLLPYIYSLFFRAHLSGRPVARALFFEFPKDVLTFGIDTQFMLGPGVMIVPILEENYTKNTIPAYLPKGFWYHHYYLNDVIESLGEVHDLQIPVHSIPILYQGGSIIVKQKGEQNTVLSRKNKFSIEAFLSSDDTADGEFFWDDGVSNLPKELVQYNQYSFKVSKNVLTMTTVFGGYDSSSMVLGDITVRGVRGSVTSAILNNVDFPFSFENKVLTLTNMTLQGPSGWTDGLTLVWS
ncbi:Lysosomal alpha-glucosidase [Folsomia candida]|uniref:Lysosomal alpha-glucosidase n=1 Tax=Folsomia candida TaxID=158441 RepID=A0A226ELP1_FOLCA|nr:Lysosomal alpha-glucosidase [Folsomia candida]